MNTRTKKFFGIYLPIILIIVIIFGASFFFRKVEKAEAGWYATGGTWTYRKQITIDHSKVGVGTTTPLIDFPMLFSVTDPDLKFTGSGGKVASSTGLDMLFTSSDGTTKLDYEMDYYSSTTGQVTAWVRIPSLSPTTDTSIYVYFGNASASDQSNKTGVWDSNYKGVWHMPDGTTLTANDSTSNAVHGTLSGPPTATSGQIDGAASLAATQYITKTSGFTSSFGNFTLSAWIRPTGTDTNGDTIFQDSRTGSGLVVFTDTSRRIDLTQRGVANNPFSSLTVANNKTYYLTVTRTGTTAIGYLYNLTDSTYTTQTITFNTAAAVSGDGGYYIGRLDLGSFNWIGWLDEVRVSSSVRSVDWVRTEYNNQSSPSTFYMYGAAQSANRSSAIASVATVSRPPTTNDWYATGGTWTYRKQITIDHSKVGVGTTTPLIDFPMLFSVTDPDLKFTGSGGKVASSTGLDMLFTSSDGTTKLDYEMDYYSSTTGQVTAWVRIPSLSPTTDTSIYVYFGNASASDQSNKTGVWDSNYKGVWHLSDGTTLSATDSTSNNRNGTLVNTPTAVAGKIDGAASGVTTSHKYISFSDTGLPSGAGARTMSGWIKETSFGTSVLLFYGTSGNSHQMSEMRFTGTNIYLEGWSDDMNYAGTIDTANWRYIVGTFDGTSGKIYLDGNLVAGPTALAWNTVLNGTGYIGHNTFDTNGDMNGARDEMRISNTYRSADWIKTEYNNQSSPSTFYVYSSFQGRTRIDSSGAIAPTVKIRGGGTGSIPAAITRTGSVGVIQSAANSGSSNITVPSDATLIVVGVMGYVNSNNYFGTGTLTIGGQSLTLGRTDRDTPADTDKASVWYRVSASLPTGTQSLAWNWGGSTNWSDGGQIIYAFYKGVDVSNPKKTDGGNYIELASNDSTVSTASLSASSGDMVWAVGYMYNGNLPTSQTWTNVSSIYGANYNSSRGVAAESFPSSNIAVSLNDDGGSGNQVYITLSAVVFKAGNTTIPGAGVKFR